MDFLLLTHFDNVLGPIAFLTVPINPKEKVEKLPVQLQKDIASLMDTISAEGFFLHSFKDITTANLFIELPSPWARGSKEMACITVITRVKNPELFKGVLEACSRKIKTNPEIYKGFHIKDRPNDKEVAKQYKVLEQLIQEFAVDVLRAKAEARTGKILVLGLDHAGKTSLVNQLNRGDFSQNEKPTLGVNIIKVAMSESELIVYDCGGQKPYRDSWITTLATPHALVYVVDLTDGNSTRQQETLEEFWRVINHFASQKQERFPILVLGNKFDLATKATDKDIIRMLNLRKIKEHPVHVGITSALTGAGVEESFKWLVTQLIHAY